jgi:hypothetical protein
MRKKQSNADGFSYRLSIGYSCPLLAGAHSHNCPKNHRSGRKHPINPYQRAEHSNALNQIRSAKTESSFFAPILNFQDMTNLTIVLSDSFEHLVQLMPIDRLILKSHFDHLNSYGLALQSHT